VYKYKESKILKFYILGETGEVGLPGIKGPPGDSGACMYYTLVEKYFTMISCVLFL
jgi:hypothetical protein